MSRPKIPEPVGEIAVSGRLEILRIHEGFVEMTWVGRTGAESRFSLAPGGEVILTITSKIGPA